MFQLTEFVQATITSVTPRTEAHGDDDSQPDGEGNTPDAKTDAEGFEAGAAAAIKAAGVKPARSRKVPA